MRKLVIVACMLAATVSCRRGVKSISVKSGTDYSERISDIEARLDALEAKVRLNDLKMSTAIEDYRELSSQLSNLDENIAEMQLELTVWVESTLESLQDSVNILVRDSLATINLGISDLEVRIAVLEASEEASDQEIADLSDELASLSLLISSMAETLSELSTGSGNLDQKITAYSIDGASCTPISTGLYISKGTKSSLLVSSDDLCTGDIAKIKPDGQAALTDDGNIFFVSWDSGNNVAVSIEIAI